MRRRLFVLLCAAAYVGAQPAVAPAGAVARAGAAPATSVAAQLGKLLEEAFPADKPGAAAIVVKDGRVLLRKASGMADIELGVPLAPDMVFRLGSITKQFTAAAVMLLVEDGKLALADRIEKHLPGYPTHGHTITIEHLLTHTSGIQSYTEMPGWMAARIQSDLPLQELIDGFKNEKMQFAPGERYRYNNSGYVLLGAIIEKASGKSYEAFLRERIFAPLGMKNSHFGSNDTIIPKRVSGYTGREELKNARYLSMTQPHAAGSLVSSVDDLLIWDAALHDERLLTRASLERMWTAYTLANGKSSGYGYGWAISKLRGRRSIEHGGGIFGFSTFALRLPEERVYVAVLSNSDSPSVSPSLLAKKLAALAVGRPFPEPVAITLAPRLLERYAGVYQVDAETKRAVSVEGGKLYSRRGGGQRLEVKFSSETEFFFDRSLTHGRFVLDETGRASEMLLHQDGADEAERAPRVPDAAAELGVAGGGAAAKQAAATQGAAAAAAPQAAVPEDAIVPDRKTPLFNGRDLSGWKADVPVKDTKPDAPDSFIVRDGMLVSLGEPRGHLLSEQRYRDYRLEVEYRFPGKGGNCGVLVHASRLRALSQMFPQSIEVQMAHGNAGDFWCIEENIEVPDMETRRPRREGQKWGGSSGDARRILNLTDGSEKPLGEWNTMVIEARGRTLKVWVNGDLVNAGFGATAESGQIAIQAEGTEVEFRRIEIAPLPAAK
jgi:CubicO group peptidase (beta-lactamase class C family)